MSDDNESEADLEARIKRLEAENERLERELTEYKAENERDKAGIRRDIHDLVEIKTDAENPGLRDIWIAGQPLGKIVDDVHHQVNRGPGHEPSARDNDNNDLGDDDDRSPLARLIDVPAERAKEFLSANQIRGRKIAQRAREIGTNTPEGLVVRSDEVAERLRRWGESSHTETVSRVMDFIEGLGTSDVRSTMHKGRRILVFDSDRVKEYGTGEEPPEVRSHRDVIPPRTSNAGTASA